MERHLSIVPEYLNNHVEELQPRLIQEKREGTASRHEEPLCVTVKLCQRQNTLKCCNFAGNSGFNLSLSPSVAGFHGLGAVQ
jgi:hypothetical protein